MSERRGFLLGVAIRVAVQCPTSCCASWVVCVSPVCDGCRLGLQGAEAKRCGLCDGALACA